MKIGINGVGRIGRTILRQLWENNIDTCVHLNDVFADIENIAYLIKYDSLFGPLKANVFVTDCREIVIEDEQKKWVISFSHEEHIKAVNWIESGVKVIVEATGLEHNTMNLEPWRKEHSLDYVVITNTCEHADFTLIHGVNEEAFDPEQHHIISTSICDANAIAPVLKIIERKVGIEQVFITTLHPWLSYQNVLDGPVRSQSQTFSTYKHYQLGRMSSGSLIPKPTTVGPVLQHVLPSLKNRLMAFSYRVPTSIVCSADISLVLKDSIGKEEMKQLFLASNPYIRASQEKLVSTDFTQEPFSSVVDLNWLEVVEAKYVKLVLWYDNEWGYTARVIQLLQMLKTLNRKVGIRH
ncbi:hypothetical protein WJ0W_006729 [Paenibacillus melissococcoides]|uniref:Glyceraldehyde 3-phosphate dehydrogenase NAD(P) binding domain-containing protein n=1 Tax=Paenibacillus melissococcoides TaxID=2912268 RepID=A0ABM9GBU3_9BACL|nr:MULTISPECIES: glyceraldehyde 3-phosphate dehydrogenase NAD-binding domain-containing protein [Paenibacillus]MEB9895022.1 glyceraldehyde 3-phosphate dehydrogenase NAD-binding domain-containing protein [Bacillus cereus]GIO79019.1 glyceraldehyde-3-phosphate dehydrogenase [Paenibacillus dendritiformis]CAH8249544.1 hypothetical protein WJ0W_006729 [Paenibacillus melissococcoides]CAH8721101.1 hypothetical protein HTL2_006190 [Paenibacillus melissococcoides]